MSSLIELGLRLEGDDAKEFWENEKKPATPQQKKLVKNAIKMYKRIGF